MTREELTGIPVLAKRIKQKEQALRELRAASVSIGSPTYTTHDRKGSHADRVGSLTARVVDLEADLQEDRLRLAELRLEALRLFQTLSEPTREAMTYRYVIGDTWQRAAEQVDIDEHYIYRLNRQALKALFDDNENPLAQT